MLKLPDKKSFNFNDCKLHDKVRSIYKKYGKIDLFTCQFTGATMHPICYNYKSSDYIKISHKKIDKFRAVLKSIEELNQNIYTISRPCMLSR